MKKRSNYSPSDIEDLEGDDPFPGDRQFVGALHRGLEILRCFRVSDDALGNHDFAERSGLPKATVSRLTYTLAKLGYLVYSQDSGKYRMGVPVLGLGYACLGGLKIRTTAQPYMQELADHAGDGALVAMGGRDDLSIIYVSCARSEGVISLQLGVGSRVSLARSSIGWAFIAAAPENERESLLRRLRARLGQERWSQVYKGITNAAEQIGSQGFCLNDGDWHPQIAAVAVPFRSSQPDVPVLAFNCGGPSSIVTRQRLKKDLGPKLVEMAAKIAAVGTVY